MTTDTPSEAFRSMNRVHALISCALDNELKSLGLTRMRYFVLTSLAATESRTCRLSTLSRAMAVHPTTITLAVRQLELDGLVVRHPHPRDRRATLTELTAAGAECVAHVESALSRSRQPTLQFVNDNRDRLLEFFGPVRAADRV